MTQGALAKAQESAAPVAPVAPSRLLVVIPAYNEANRIGSVVRKVRSQLAARAAGVLVVDDGSSDCTSEEARAAGATVATHPVNLGYGAALQTGYRFALRHGFASVLQMDADGQHDPASICALLDALDAGADVVVGSRFLHGGSYRPPLLRRIGMAIFGRIASYYAGMKLTDPTSGYQALSARALAFYDHDRYPPDYPDADVLSMVARHGLRLVEVPVRMLESPDGKSMHSGVLKPLYYIFRMSLALALVPLRRERP
ncbi:glycosyltransferase family 2 protein [Anaeromyxobacter oryzisoli]|uniref:glycosyltransferase family 2 protein n=1 Tax=Anaeromyxobacter oryzisoli TaxID=2925408 RepID=UPI001F569270|nr:glycosyltransferase family 2 protein [Anaeromyxobacter sp. SG63]